MALLQLGVILLFVFGGVVAAGMPLIVGILSILGSLSLLAILAQFQQVNIFSQSIITLLGLGLAIDYGLFMVSRFREELDRGLRCAFQIVVGEAAQSHDVEKARGEAQRKIRG